MTKIQTQLSRRSARVLYCTVIIKELRMNGYDGENRRTLVVTAVATPHNTIASVT